MGNIWGWLRWKLRCHPGTTRHQDTSIRPTSSDSPGARLKISIISFIQKGPTPVAHRDVHIPLNALGTNRSVADAEPFSSFGNLCEFKHTHIRTRTISSSLDVASV